MLYKASKTRPWPDAAYSVAVWTARLRIIRKLGVARGQQRCGEDRARAAPGNSSAPHRDLVRAGRVKMEGEDKPEDSEKPSNSLLFQPRALPGPGQSKP